MAAVTSYDLVVLGGGSGGYAAALRAGELGLSVALVERDLVGGTCLHRGCIPTKALLHAAEVADATRDAGRFGVQATLEGVDLPAVNEYAQQVVGRLYRGLNSLIAARQITVIDGAGRLEAGDGIPDRPGRRRISCRVRTWCWPPARTRRRCPDWRSTGTGC